MEKPLNAKDICSIIASCAKNEVTRFSFGDLSIEFDKKPLIAEPTQLDEPFFEDLNQDSSDPHQSFDDYEPEIDEQELKDYALLTDYGLAEELELAGDINVQRQKAR